MPLNTSYLIKNVGTGLSEKFIPIHITTKSRAKGNDFKPMSYFHKSEDFVSIDEINLFNLNLT